MDGSLIEDVYSSLLAGCACGLNQPTEWMCIIKKGNEHNSGRTLCELGIIRLTCEVVREGQLAGKLCPQLLSMITVFQSPSVTECLHYICVSTSCKFQRYGAVQAIIALVQTSSCAWNNISTLLKKRVEDFGNLTGEKKVIYFQIMSKMLQVTYGNSHPLGKFDVACTSALPPRQACFSPVSRHDISEVLLKWWTAVWKEGVNGTSNSYLYSLLALWTIVLDHSPHIVTFEEHSINWLIETAAGPCPLLSNACLEVSHKGLQSVVTEPDVTIQSSVLTLAKKIVDAVGGRWLDEIHYRTVFCGFGGTLLEEHRTAPAVNKRCIVGDTRMLRLVLLTVFKASLLHVQGRSTVATALYRTLAWMSSKAKKQDWTQENIITEIFLEQDDQLLECLLLLLLLHLKLSKASPTSESSTAHGQAVIPSPHTMFLLFLRSLCYDHSALIDLLTSSETCALFYFVRYLKIVTSDWSGFLAAHAHLNTSSPHDSELSTVDEFHVDNSMAVLIRLTLKLERMSEQALIPFNVKPLLKLLKKCENLYEGDESGQ